MNKFKILVAVLMCSFVIMTGATIGQKVSASIIRPQGDPDPGPEPRMSCQHLNDCNQNLSCPGRGTVINKCVINCSAGVTIYCNIPQP